MGKAFKVVAWLAAVLLALWALIFTDRSVTSGANEPREGDTYELVIRVSPFHTEWMAESWRKEILSLFEETSLKVAAAIAKEGTL